MLDDVKVSMARYPTDDDWMEVKRDALATMGMKPISKPGIEWKHRMLVARHSPIRDLEFTFELDGIPYWLSTELSRHHAGCQPYIRSQRNDRQNVYDRNAARQDAPVRMRWRLNAEALMTVANKRLCMKATAEARHIVGMMCRLVEEQLPEFKGVLVPMCLYHGGRCHQVDPCGLRDYDGMEK